jgi:hypothetical protein
MDSSSDELDLVKAEQGEIKAVVDESDKSNNDEAKQISAYKTLTELKELRNKQRKF